MRRRRPLAIALFLYGALGIVLIVVGAVVGLGLAARVERLATSADEALLAAARTIRTTSEAFTGVDASLRDAAASTTSAAGLSREAAATLDSLAAAMEISIFGAQPLVTLADDFSASSAQADELADALDGVVTSLADSRTDVAAIGAEMDQLAADLEAVRDTDADRSTPPIRAFVALLLAWLALPAVGALLLGIFLWPDREAQLVAPTPPAVVVAPASSVGAVEDAPQAEQRADVEDHTDPQQHP